MSRKAGNEQVPRGERMALANRIALLIKVRRPKSISLTRLSRLVCEEGMFPESRWESLRSGIISSLAKFDIKVNEDYTIEYGDIQ